jgi:hypothetical protein
MWPSSSVSTLVAAGDDTISEIGIPFLAFMITVADGMIIQFSRDSKAMGDCVRHDRRTVRPELAPQSAMAH